MRIPRLSPLVRRAAAAALMLLPLAATRASAQVTDSVIGMSARAQLEARLADVQRRFADSSGDAERQRQLQREAQLLTRRLREGDFMPGDRLVLYLRDQQTIQDTLTVRTGSVLFLPAYGEIQLAGVLWAEAQGHISRQLARWVRDPDVRVTPLVRIGMLGAVNRPGFYSIPTDMPLADAIMLAGGLASGGEPSRSVIRREGDELWGRANVRDALARGSTVDELALRAGDEIVVGSARKVNWQVPLQAATIVTGIVFALLARR